MRRTSAGGLPARARWPRLLGSLLGACVLLPGAGPCARAAESNPEVDYALQTLREAHLPTDGPALVKYFRDRTLSEADQAKLAGTVRLLGDEDFHVRRKAYKELVVAGRNALPFLEEGKKSPDPEVARSAERLIKLIESGSDATIASAAARVLAASKPPGTVPALLAYLPLARDEWVQEALIEALAAAGVKDGKVDGALRAAVTDKDPARRIAAAVAACKAGPEGRRAVLPLLKDPNVRVRYHAASRLVLAGDKAGVEPLIGVLGDGPRELAWQAEDLLCRLAGETAPAALEIDNAEKRLQGRKAWETWWQTNGPRADLTRLHKEKADRGITVIVEHDGSGKDNQGRIWACGRDGKPRWDLDAMMGGPLDLRVLPGGNYLVAEYNAQRVTERNRKNQVVWTYKCKTSVLSAQRLPNGNTLIATMNELLEVTRDQKVVFSMPGGSYYYATKLRNGHILYTTATHVVELDATRKAIKNIPLAGVNWGSVELLANGHFLVSLYGGNRVVEIDGTGKVHWQANVSSPTMAIRLKNGNTVVGSSEGKMVVELNRDGKEVWKKTTSGRVWRIRRY